MIMNGLSLGKLFHDTAFCFLYHWCQMCHAFVPDSHWNYTPLRNNVEELDKRMSNWECRSIKPRVNSMLTGQRWMNFPGSPVVKTLSSQCREHRLNPWLGEQDPVCHVVQPISTLSKINNKASFKNAKEAHYCGVREDWHWLGPSIHRGGDGTPHQYSCLANPMDRGAW